MRIFKWALWPVACVGVKAYSGLPKAIKIYLRVIRISLIILLQVSSVCSSLRWKSIRAKDVGHALSMQGSVEVSHGFRPLGFKAEGWSCALDRPLRWEFVLQHGVYHAGLLMDSVENTCEPLVSVEAYVMKSPLLPELFGSLHRGVPVLLPSLVILYNSQLPLEVSLVQFTFGSCNILKVAFVGVAICAVFWTVSLGLIALEAEPNTGLSAFPTAHHPR